MNDIDALDVGLGYALAGTLVDAQTARIEDALHALEQPYMGPAGPVDVQITEPTISAHNARNLATNLPHNWDNLVGQHRVKRKMLIHATSAKQEKRRLPHTLFASNKPGVGKTHISRLVADLMGVNQYELVPPFNIYTIVEAALTLDDHDMLFIDEIHKLSDNGTKGAEILLKILEEGWAPMPDGRIVYLPDITIVGATTDKGKLPRTVIDRFKIRPNFEEYTYGELAEIAVIFSVQHEAWKIVTDELACTIAKACRNTPRVTEDMVIACKDLFNATGAIPTSEDMLDFAEVEPDGMGMDHIRYLTALRTKFRRTTKKGLTEYFAGEVSLASLVRVDRKDLIWIEQFLTEKGYIDRTPQGRRLTDLGVARAEEFLAAGKGVSA